MDPTAPITADLMLAALNGSFDYGQDRRALAVMFGLTAAPTKEYVGANQDFRQLLRNYVDMWLETGREQDGTERPLVRKPTMVIQALVTAYLRTHPALPVHFDNGYQVAIPFRLESFPSLRPKRPYSFRELPSGERVRLVRGVHKPRNDVKDDAQRLFVGMLFTRWSMRVAKCRHATCGRYYILNKPRVFYKRGTVCRRCSSSLSAAQRTTDQRRRQHETLLRAAVRAYAEWHAKASLQRSSLKAYISRELRRQRGEVTVKWVTRHMKEIQAVGA